jgi:hypothetical protein
MARFLLSIFIMLLSGDQLRDQLTLGRASTPCSQPDTCALSFWMIRAAHLGALLERASSRDVAIDAYTPCVPEGARESKDGVTVRVHARFPPELEATVPTVPRTPRRNGPPTAHALTITLLKWVAVSLTDAEHVVCFDLDMDIFLPELDPFAAIVVAQWLDAFARMRIVGAQLASLPDHSAPINAGFMLVRPNRSLYEEGVQLLLRANSSWTEAEGWELLGKPQAVVPSADIMQFRKARNSYGHAWIAQGNSWRFVGAAFDQGFFFHMYAGLCRRSLASPRVPPLRRLAFSLVTVAPRRRAARLSPSARALLCVRSARVRQVSSAIVLALWHRPLLPPASSRRPAQARQAPRYSSDSAEARVWLGAHVQQAVPRRHLRQQGASD